MKVENGLIIDTGGYTPHTQLNEQTGRYEEQKQFIVTGCVVEVGPEVKYLKEGDVIFIGLILQYLFHFLSRDS